MNVVALDIGNTDIKFGLFLNGALAKFWRASDFAPVHQYKRPEHFSNALRAGLASIGNTFEGLVYSTVVPEMEYILKKTLQYCFTVRTPIVAIKPGISRLPLKVEGYPTSQLGIDRLVTACGAHLMYPNQHIILADFGTAATFDVITADSRFLGGVIAPGIETFSKVLPEKASQLPYVPFGPCNLAIGQSTLQCMQSGISFGYLGLVKEIIQRIESELQTNYGIVDPFEETPQVLRLATGGGAATFMEAFPEAGLFASTDPTMTIKGLYALYIESTHPKRRLLELAKLKVETETKQVELKKVVLEHPDLKSPEPRNTEKRFAVKPVPPAPVLVTPVPVVPISSKAIPIASSVAAVDPLAPPTDEILPEMLEMNRRLELSLSTELTDLDHEPLEEPENIPV